MESIKIFLILCLLFNLSNCLNAAANTFRPYRIDTDTKCSMVIKGSWENNVYPTTLSFRLHFLDGNDMVCIFVIAYLDRITCTKKNVTINSRFGGQYMDKKDKLLPGVYGPCLSASSNRAAYIESGDSRVTYASYNGANYFTANTVVANGNYLAFTVVGEGAARGLIRALTHNFTYTYNGTSTTSEVPALMLSGHAANAGDDAALLLGTTYGEATDGGTV